MAAAIATCLATLPGAHADIITTYTVGGILFNPSITGGLTTLGNAGGSFEYDQSTSAYVSGSASFNVEISTDAPEEFAILNGIYSDPVLSISTPPEITVLTQTTPANTDDRMEVEISAEAGHHCIVTVGSLTQEGLNLATIDSCIATATTVTTPAPVLGAGIPGLLAGLGAFLFWRRRSAVGAALVLGRRCFTPIAS
jgi:hypothetical protein